MQGYEVRILTGKDYPLWNGLIARSSQGTIFHTTEWLTFCSRELDLDLKIFGCFKSEELLGGVPLFFHRWRGLLRVGDSVCSLSPYTGIVIGSNLAQEPDVRTHRFHGVIDALCDVIEEESLNLLNITTPPEFRDLRPFLWRGWRETIRYTHHFDLTGDIDAKLHRKIRNIIQNAPEQGISIEESADIDSFQRLYSTTFTRKNLEGLVKTRAFGKMLTTLKRLDAGAMFAARLPEGNISNMAIVLWDSRRAYVLSAASDPVFFKSNGMTVLFYYILHDMKKRGIPEVDMMMANLPKLSKFAEKFNPRIVPYFSVEWGDPMIRIARSVGRGFWQIS